MEKKLILDVHEKPKVAHWIALSIQHVWFNGARSNVNGITG